jgi:hypothetical protein
MKASSWRVPLWIGAIVATLCVYWSCGKNGSTSNESNANPDSGAMSLSVGSNCRYLGPHYACETYADVEAPLE